MKSLLVGRLPACPSFLPTRRVAGAAGFLSALLLQVLGFVAAPPPARALTVLTRDFDGLVARAETIFKGTVSSQESLWLGDGPGRHIATRVTFQVLETYKGVAASSQTLEFLGGTVDGRTVRVPGVPQFVLGETSILFVVGNGVQLCPLVGAFQGRFAVEKDAATAEERVYRHDHRPVTNTEAIGREGEATVSGNPTTPRTGTAEPSTRSNGATSSNTSALTVAQFKAAIAQKLQERRAKGLPEGQKD